MIKNIKNSIEIKMKRLPAEWEKQEFVQLVFPHIHSDWSDYLDEALNCFINIAIEVAKQQKCLIICNKSNIKKIKSIIPLNKNFIFAEIDSNDTWSRDFGGITIFEESKAKILNFGFNGWGLKFASNFDNQITMKLNEMDIFNNRDLETKDIILEGGSIDSNGNGVILTTTKCLLESNRNPHLSKYEIENKLKEYFGIDRIIWLNYGYLAGDDTDSHIDTLARFINKNTIIYTKCYDKNDEHYNALLKMEDELKKSEFNLIALPLPEAKYFEGDRLPATYANFLIINNAVLVPTYNDINDKIAINIFKKNFTNRKIIAIDCSVLIKQHGSLHCVTMQYH